MDKYCVRFGGFIDKDGPQFPKISQRFVKVEVAESIADELAELKVKHRDMAIDQAKAFAALLIEIADYKVTVHAARLRAEETGTRVNELEAALRDAAQPEISPHWVPRSWHDAMMRNAALPSPAEPKSYWPCGHEVVNDQDGFCRWCPPS